ncbi:MAG: hypothetical protein NTX57_17160 [Armatimonadetes bacterium]|nr:hypothetical protein [Armatimonadota bacterium]
MKSTRLSFSKPSAVKRSQRLMYQLRGLVGEGNRIARRLLDLQSEISVSPEIKKYAVA